MTETEINKLIHEKVMGECWHELDKIAPIKVMRSGESMRLMCGKCGDFSRQFYRPAYSSDMALAWKVVERFRELGFAVGLCTPGYLYSWESGMYQCQITHKEIFQGGGHVEKAETMEMAICLTAISVIERGQHL